MAKLMKGWGAVWKRCWPRPATTMLLIRLQVLPVGRLQPGKYQPRSRMDQEWRWRSWPRQFRAQGLMQPILVRLSLNGAYEIIAGERRWRAAQLAELKEVPVVVRQVADEAALAMALIENIQREDLNALEEALVFSV